MKIETTTATVIHLTGDDILELLADPRVEGISRFPKGLKNATVRVYDHGAYAWVAVPSKSVVVHVYPIPLVS